MEQIQQQIVPAAPESLPRIRAAVMEALAVVPAPRRQAAALAVTEACGNVVRHAYRGERGTIEVTVRRRDDALVVRVRDHGVGLRTPTATPGLGLGMSLIASGADEVSLDSGDWGTAIEMLFAPAPLAA